ncbi:MAG: hypothetical protein JNJ54_05045 [Myxococcaceae bacterium]|nr:hypothetical protein [Myxococcaceae bacterium]
MRLRLDVTEGPALIWNGAPVVVPSDLRDWLYGLRLGSTLEVQCQFHGGAVTVTTAEGARVLTEGGRGLDSVLAQLLNQGSTRPSGGDALLRRLDAEPQSAATHAWRARALLERHHQANRWVDSPVATTERGVAEDALAASLALGGPDVAVDAPNSPWVSWGLLARAERDASAFRLASALMPWVFASLRRTSRDALGPFTPVASLLAGVLQQDWPPAPWLAWGLAPRTWDKRVLAVRLAPAVADLALDDGERKALLPIAAEIAAGRPLATRNSGHGLVGVLLTLQQVASGARTLKLVELLERATRRVRATVKARFFREVNEALCVAELAALLPEGQSVGRVERVVFRGTTGRREASGLSLALLDDGRFLAVVPGPDGAQRLVTEGDLDEVLAAVPEPLFPLAVTALKGAGAR